jgi:hypothetical protein
MEGTKTFLATARGRATAIALCVLAIALLAWMLRSYFGPSDAVRRANTRTFICSETGKVFEVTIKEGMTIPIHSKYSGKDTGWPAEFCYWNADGSTRKDPTPVLLRLYKGQKDPTFCPDCGRLVVGHNPMPMAGMKPPPTEGEYAKRRGAGGDGAKADSRR